MDSSLTPSVLSMLCSCPAAAVVAVLGINAIKAWQIPFTSNPEAAAEIPITYSQACPHGVVSCLICIIPFHDERERHCGLSVDDRLSIARSASPISAPGPGRNGIRGMNKSTHKLSSSGVHSALELVSSEDFD